MNIPADLVKSNARETLDTSCCPARASVSLSTVSRHKLLLCSSQRLSVLSLETQAVALLEPAPLCPQSMRLRVVQLIIQFSRHWSFQISRTFKRQQFYSGLKNTPVGVRNVAVLCSNGLHREHSAQWALRKQCWTSTNVARKAYLYLSHVKCVYISHLKCIYICPT